MQNPNALKTWHSFRWREGKVDSAQSYNEKVAPLVRAHSDTVVSSIVSGRIQALKKNYGDAAKIFQTVIGDTDAPASLRWEAQSRLAGVYASEGKRTAADEGISTRDWHDCQCAIGS